MPKREDLKTIMVLGSGPIVIGQAAEFDYSGTQGLKALKEEGCRIVLLNSNPATVMTDTAFSDATYIEPMNKFMAAEIIIKERPDAILPTLGGQTALNLLMDLHHMGILEEYNVEIIGAQPKSIELAENRQKFRETMEAIGLDLPKSALATTFEQAMDAIKEISFPVIIRPSYTLGGTGGGIAYNIEEFKEIAKGGIEASPISQILIEESVLGWKEIELEVVRDKADNAIVICGIENLDPMGVHTGDSITVAPIQTLSDAEYQALRQDAFRVVRAIGVETGGCNIQFAVCPKTGRRVVIEMNPRVSRSSALASKATGFPIARIAAKLALGYRLDELKNDITGTSACFEPTIDYCVVKVPRFNFEKFTGADTTLGFQMHSVGETMALGGNFREALQKAFRGLETGLQGLQNGKLEAEAPIEPAARREWIREKLYLRRPDRVLLVYEGMQLGLTVEELNEITGIDPWFLLQIKRILDDENSIRQDFCHEIEKAVNSKAADAAFAKKLRHYKAQGFSDARIANLCSESLAKTVRETDIRSLREINAVEPVFHTVDTCAGEFEAHTPYFYSTYDAVSPDPLHTAHVGAATRGFARKVVIIGGGPNRIGQGLEFDYCCVQACFSLRELGIKTIMINSNPETVSTDYDTADTLYFEPVTTEDVLAVCHAEKPDGVIVQFGGQTPLNIAMALQEAGVPIIGTKPQDIALAEDREDFSALIEDLDILQPASGMAVDLETACRLAETIGYPVMVRPSFVLGGRAMRIIHNEQELIEYIEDKSTGLYLSVNTPILVDKFLEEAIEIDVDAVVDGDKVTIAAIMEHIEQAGIHSGDSCCSIPTHTLSDEVKGIIRSYTDKLGKALHTVGLLNIQMALYKGSVYVIEANPRASRTVPFVSKATGRNVAGIAAKIMTGLSLKDVNFTEEPKLMYSAVKEAVIPFERFPGTQIQLGPEMRSTGEVMGIDRSFGMAFLKSQAGTRVPIPVSGNVILTVTDQDKEPLVPLAARLKALGFTLYATPGTKAMLENKGIDCKLIVKIGQQRPHLLDFIRNGEANMIVNTVSGPTSARDANTIRTEALARRINLITTLAALRATVEGLEARRQEQRIVAPLQDYYAGYIQGKTNE
ncbi:carbamoyl-phosphate synthase large subunit [Taurinivorans muris]|uniref:Carbamoyl phosphate synthase large chain n=1 Tax=Taurinivorans muris TaxID=2787751 RepID=A0ABY5XYT7_9BACT|nr:carbamoyl-phosphate synthase large subunit [Desulfovibrionaceae bacterium LT0009]